MYQTRSRNHFIRNGEQHGVVVTAEFLHDLLRETWAAATARSGIVLHAHGAESKANTNSEKIGGWTCSWISKESHKESIPNVYLDANELLMVQ